MTIIDKLKELGYETVSEDYYSYIELWLQWYRGLVPQFHEYKVFNGLSRVKLQKLTAGMAKKAAENWADLLMNEKVHITLEGDAEQQFFDDFCVRNNFERMMNIYQEYCFALGTSAYVVRVSGLTVDGDGVAISAAENLILDFVMADGIFPLSWKNGEIDECAFATVQVYDNHKYCYLQIHHRDESGSYLIENHLYDNTSGNMAEVELTSVAAFASVAPIFHTHSDQRLFVIDTPNIANNIDPDVPLGVSIYANGIDQLKLCDTVFNSVHSEIELGRKRIIVKPEAVRNLDGEAYFDPNDLVFYVLPEDSSNESTIHEVDAKLRIEEHTVAMQLALNMLAMKCGFGTNHWKFDAGHITTATQVISANSEEFRTLKKHEIILEEVLIELARIVLRLGNEFMGQHLDEDVEISVDFDDSIIEDDGTEFERDMRMMSSGILNPYEFRMKWMNEDEETAKAALPPVQSLVLSERGADE